MHVNCESDGYNAVDRLASVLPALAKARVNQEAAYISAQGVRGIVRFRVLVAGIGE